MDTGKAAPPPQIERFGYSITETCQGTGLSRSKIYQLIQAGKLKAVKVGSRTIITPEAIRQMLADMGA